MTIFPQVPPPAAKEWITRARAIEIIERSDWAYLKHPTVMRKVSFAERLTFWCGRIEHLSGPTSEEKTAVKYDVYLSMTLTSFMTNNPSHTKTEYGTELVDQASLETFLQKALDAEVIRQFGEAPRIEI